MSWDQLTLIVMGFFDSLPTNKMGIYWLRKKCRQLLCVLMMWKTIFCLRNHFVIVHLLLSTFNCSLMKRCEAQQLSLISTYRYHIITRRGQPEVCVYILYIFIKCMYACIYYVNTKLMRLIIKQIRATEMQRRRISRHIASIHHISVIIILSCQRSLLRNMPPLIENERRPVVLSLLIAVIANMSNAGLNVTRNLTWWMLTDLRWRRLVCISLNWNWLNQRRFAIGQGLKRYRQRSQCSGNYKMTGNAL